VLLSPLALIPDGPLTSLTAPVQPQFSRRIVHGDDQPFPEDPERLVDAADLRGMPGIEESPDFLLVASQPPRQLQG
jgi:hypothetical protein